ncbi:MAG: indolepyruvate ferredoxin oxidoreductase [Proteobacteria bacterium]|nr:indolepyruvate ferredoxin oxidoreductase [Pseudomonadota bacterium]
MPDIDIDAPGKTLMLMGNEAIARGALEAGVGFAAAYPGTPSTEILPTLAGVAERRNLYAEWSINEIVAFMNAAAASYAGIRSMAAMKQNGTNVAMDMIANQINRGQRGGGGLVLVNVDDPSGRNSPNEQDTRSVAKMLDIPMLEPGDFQEAKDMTKWLFELSEELDCLVMLRAVAKITHTRGNVTLGELSTREKKAHFNFIPKFPSIPPKVPVVDLMTLHAYVHEKLKRAQERFEESPFNRYSGPDQPDLLLVCCGASYLYSMEAVNILGLGNRVGVLKLGTIWPLPEKLIQGYLEKTQRILFVEEVDPFIERGVMELTASLGPTGPRPEFYGKRSGHIASYGDLDPDAVIKALVEILGVEYQSRDPEYSKKVQAASQDEVIARPGTMCPGCPHRASYWAINKALKLDGREGFATADAGCMSAGLGPGGFFVAKIMGCMGGGAGLADGLGKLKQFGFTQPVIGGEGDSTFFHAAIPPLLNAVWNQSDFTLVVYDNSTTAMTGFQPHPGVGSTAMGTPGKVVPIENICRGFGLRVEICDPFELEKTTDTMLDVLRDEGHGPRVVIMRHECELQRARREGPQYEMSVNQDKCLGEGCGCDRLCVRVFRCSGLKWNGTTGKSEIDDVLCCGCGLCTDVCPQGAIDKKAIAPIINQEKATEEGVQP